MILADRSLCDSIEIFAAAPIPHPPTPAPPSPRIPMIGPLTASILSSVDKLFFISHCIPGSTTTEWALVRVDLQRSVCAHPPALQDGRFLVDFYTCHPADKRYNAVNQRFWLEYHPTLEVANPYRDRCTHMIRPSAQSASYAIAEGLRPFSQWIRLTNADTFIVGPFDFAVINGRKSKDRVSLAEWKILHQFKHLFNNEAPCLDLPDYSVHCGQFHTSFLSKDINSRVAAYLTAPSSPSTV